MTITPQQLEDRRKGIGASDVPALFGCGYRTAYDLWLDKTGKLSEDANESNEAMEIGNDLEPAIGQMAAKRLRLEPSFEGLIASPPTFIHPAGVLRANLDFLANFAGGLQTIVEAKSTAVGDDWGPEGTDDVPNRVIFQVQAQFACSGLKIAHVAQLLMRFRASFRLYQVDRNQEICDAIVERAHEFWTKNVVADIPPDGIPSLDVVKHVVRVPKKTISIPPATAAAYLSATEDAKVAEEARDAAKAALIAALGDAEEGVYDGGRFTYFEQTRKETVQRASTFRVLRAAKAK